jgi:hypothetical protein
MRPHVERLGAPCSSQVRVRRLRGLLVMAVEGEELGYWWRSIPFGVAWRDPRVFRVWCAPFPLNLIFGWSHDLWWWLLYGRGRRRVTRLESSLAQANEAVKRTQEQVLDVHAERQVLRDRLHTVREQLEASQSARLELVSMFLEDVEMVAGPEATSEIRTEVPPQEPAGLGNS